jgi:hypothetical protein
MKVVLSNTEYVRVFAGTIAGEGETLQFLDGEAQTVEIPETAEVVVGVKNLGKPELLHLKEGKHLPVKLLVVEADGTVRITKDNALVLRSYLTAHDPVVIINPKTEKEAEVINPALSLKSKFLAARLAEKPADARRIAKAVPESRKLIAAMA